MNIKTLEQGESRLQKSFDRLGQATLETANAIADINTFIDGQVPPTNIPSSLYAGDTKGYKAALNELIGFPTKSAYWTEKWNLSRSRVKHIVKAVDLLQSVGMPEGTTASIAAALEAIHHSGNPQAAMKAAIDADDDGHISAADVKRAANGKDAKEASISEQTEREIVAAEKHINAACAFLARLAKGGEIMLAHNLANSLIAVSQSAIDSAQEYQVKAA